jgi:hypothetical protein
VFDQCGGVNACFGCTDEGACNYDVQALQLCTTGDESQGYCETCKYGMGCTGVCGDGSDYDGCGYCVGGTSSIPVAADEDGGLAGSIFMDDCGCCQGTNQEMSAELKNYCWCFAPNCSCAGCMDDGSKFEGEDGYDSIYPGYAACNLNEGCDTAPDGNCYIDNNWECKYPNFVCAYEEELPHPGACQLGKLMCSINTGNINDIIWTDACDGGQVNGDTCDGGNGICMYDCYDHIEDGNQACDCTCLDDDFFPKSTTWVCEADGGYWKKIIIKTSTITSLITIFYMIITIIHTNSISTITSITINLTTVTCICPNNIIYITSVNTTH